jgi:hypothetical protein
LTPKRAASAYSELDSLPQHHDAVIPETATRLPAIARPPQPRRSAPQPKRPAGPEVDRSALGARVAKVILLTFLAFAIGAGAAVAYVGFLR